MTLYTFDMPIQSIQRTKQQLRKKLEARPIPADGMKFSVRLPDSTKLECILARDSSTKVRLVHWLLTSRSLPYTCSFPLHSNFHQYIRAYHIIQLVI